MLMLDICSGLGGASQAMRDRGWQVITVDIDPQFKPDILADVRSWSWRGVAPDLIWCSPPCTDFSRESMPWCRTGQIPDLTIVNACKRIIGEHHPTYWVIENVRGAVRWLGQPRAIVGPFYLWGIFPDLGNVQLINYRKKESWASCKRAQRALIPYELSLAVATAIESQALLISELQ